MRKDRQSSFASLPIPRRQLSIFAKLQVPAADDQQRENKQRPHRQRVARQKHRDKTTPEHGKQADDRYGNGVHGNASDTPSAPLGESKKKQEISHPECEAHIVIERFPQTEVRMLSENILDLRSTFATKANQLRAARHPVRMRKIIRGRAKEIVHYHRNGGAAGVFKIFHHSTQEDPPRRKKEHPDRAVKNEIE